MRTTPSAHRQAPEQPKQTTASTIASPVNNSARYDRRQQTGCTLSVILPTYNEAENLVEVVSRIGRALIDLDYEIVVVDDDSPDRTWEVADELAASNPRVRTLRRVNERGLSSAVLAGMHLANGKVLAVMDADLQHDEQALVDLTSRILDDGASIVIGSREAPGGSYGDWSRWRRGVSWVGKTLAQQVVGTQVTDPMSGFFAVSRDEFEASKSRINPRGFKILLEFLARSKNANVQEVGYEFRDRVHGSTKMTTSVVGSYLVALLDLFIGRVVSSTFTAYALVGVLGTVIRFGSVTALDWLGVAGMGIFAFEASILVNYWLHNRFTFAPTSRRGIRFFTGLLPFHLVALHGLIVQVGLLSVIGGSNWSERALFGDDSLLVGPLWLQAIGIAIATTGNFIGNRAITWRTLRSA